MYQYILFDLDGTLTDPREGITKSVQYALDKMGISEPDLSALEHFIGPPLYDEFRRCYQMDDAQAKKTVEAYRERFGVIGWQENILFDGVPELLAALRNAGRKIAIASSKPTVFVRKILHMFEIERYFDVVSGASLDGSIGARRRSCSRRSMRSACPTSKPLSSSATASTMSRAHARAVWTASASRSASAAARNSKPPVRPPWSIRLKSCAASCSPDKSTELYPEMPPLSLYRLGFVWYTIRATPHNEVLS